MTFLHDLAPVLVTGLLVLLGTVGVLTRHQQRMARILHRSDSTELQNQTQLQLEQMRQMLTQQAIAIDNLSQSQRLLAERLAEKDRLTERLETR